MAFIWACCAAVSGTTFLGLQFQMDWVGFGELLVVEDPLGESNCCIDAKHGVARGFSLESVNLAIGSLKLPPASQFVDHGGMGQHAVHREGGTAGRGRLGPQEP